MDEEIREIMVVKQLPIITEYFEQLSKQIETKIELAMSLEVTEDTVKNIKKIRAELNKEFTDLEEKRKSIKKQILTPYNEFEEQYNKYVAQLYKKADFVFKEQIEVVEDGLKTKKYEEVEKYFEELVLSMNLQDYVKFINLGIVINMSSTVTKLKKEVKERLNKIKNDLEVISYEDYKDEILADYLKHFNFFLAKTNVMKRKAEEKRIKELSEQRNKPKTEMETKVEAIIEQEVITPVEISVEEEQLTCTFTVTATRNKIIKLRDFMNEENIKFVNG